MSKELNIITRDFSITRGQGEEFIFEISNETVDSHGTVIKKSALGLDRYKKNPIVTLGHPDYNSPKLDYVVGTSEIFYEGNSTMARYIPEEGNPEAEMVVRKIKNKTANMASVRAVMTDGRYGIEDRGEDPNVFYFTKGYLLDWGIMMHGSNPEALHKSTSRAIENITAKDKKEDRDPKENLIQNSIQAARLIINHTLKKLQ